MSTIKTTSVHYLEGKVRVRHHQVMPIILQTDLQLTVSESFAFSPFCECVFSCVLHYYRQLLGQYYYSTFI